MNKPSKSDLLYRLLAERISSLGDGERFPTLREIMKEYQVGQFTAAPALRRLQGDGLLVSHVGRGTFVVRGRKPRKDAKILFLRPDWPSSSLTAMEEAFREAILTAGYRCEIRRYPVNTDIYRALPEYEADAVILSPLQADQFTAEQLQILTGSTRPVVLCRPTLPVLNIKCVGADFVATGLSAFSYLHSRGHRKIGILLSEHRAYTAATLIDTMCHCARSLGGEISVLDVNVQYGMDSRVMTRKYLETNYPDGRFRDFSALFVYTYEAAFVVKDFLDEKGVSVPGDISLMSYGFCSIPGRGQDITSITAPLPKQGRAIMEIIDRQFAGEFDSPGQITILPEIIECHSVATLPLDRQWRMQYETISN